MPKCIYCLEEKDHSEFSRDHVIPKSFGGFQNALTLVGCVCGKCNQYFGDNVELFLARDSYEGWLRYDRGVKNAGQFKFLDGMRCDFRLAGEGEFSGMIVRLVYDESSDDIALEPLVQVGIPGKGESGLEYFELEELPPADELERRGFDMDRKSDFRIIFNMREKKDVLKLLKEKGMKFRTDAQPEPLPVQGLRRVEARAVIDKVIARSISKIGFNYLTIARGVDVVLDTGFDPVRRFVRYGEGNAADYVQIKKSPLLYREGRSREHPADGHIVMVSWDANTFALSSYVSLFNKTAYKVTLNRHFSGICTGILSAHRFDLESMTVSKLEPSSIVFPWE